MPRNSSITRRSASSAGSPQRERGIAIGTALLSYVTMPNSAPQHKRRARARTGNFAFPPPALGARQEDHGWTAPRNGFVRGAGRACR